MKCALNYFLYSYSASLLALSACSAPAPSSPLDLDSPAVRRGQVDVLFVVDNSAAMGPFQRVVAAAAPRFFKTMHDAGLDYHVAVTTSDVGSWPMKERSWPSAPNDCYSYEGDDGRLQRQPCSLRTGQYPDDVDTCMTYCPKPEFVPQGGQGFIRANAASTNVPFLKDPLTGRDIGPERTFQCLVLVGSTGCSIEGPLEGARRALDRHLPENDGFLRPDSLLALIFLTDEDDCSVSATRRAENNPQDRDCGVPDRNASWQCYNTDYRCLAASTECDEPLNTPGKKTGCREKPQSYLESISTYVHFLNQLRPDRSRLFVGGIWALPSFADAGGTFDVAYSQGGSRSSDLNRARGPKAACVHLEAGVYGLPQQRLSKFIRSFPNQLEHNLCAVPDYPDALERIAQAISAQAKNSP